MPLSSIGASSQAFNQGLDRLGAAARNMPLTQIEAQRAKREAEMQDRMVAEAKMMSAQAQRDAAGAKGADSATAQRSAQLIASILTGPEVFKTPESTRDAVGKLMATGDPGAQEAAQGIMGKLNEMRPSQESGGPSMASQAHGTEQSLNTARASEAAANADVANQVVDARGSLTTGADKDVAGPTKADVDYATAYVASYAPSDPNFLQFWKKGLEPEERALMALELAESYAAHKRSWIQGEGRGNLPSSEQRRGWMATELDRMLKERKIGRSPESLEGNPALPTPQPPSGQSRGAPPVLNSGGGSGMGLGGQPKKKPMRRIGPGGNER